MSWIKIEENLPDKPEVCQMAARLSLDVDTVTGKLIRVWAWASRNCHASGVTSVTVMSHLDRVTGVMGFMDALIETGWCKVEGEDLHFTNFDRHNSQTAKDRALAARRKAESRRENVAEMSRSKPDKSVTREEKIISEVATVATPPTPKGTASDLEASFDTFWKAWPKKRGKDAAFRAWPKAAPFLTEILAALEWQRESDQWSQIQFIPDPATYLHGKLWRDDPASYRRVASHPGLDESRIARGRPASVYESAIVKEGDVL